MAAERAPVSSVSEAEIVVLSRIPFREGKPTSCGSSITTKSVPKLRVRSEPESAKISFFFQVIRSQIQICLSVQNSDP
jgi:hypothetical protein